MLRPEVASGSDFSHGGAVLSWFLTRDATRRPPAAVKTISRPMPGRKSNVLKFQPCKPLHKMPPPRYPSPQAFLKGYTLRSVARPGELNAPPIRSAGTYVFASAWAARQGNFNRTSLRPYHGHDRHHGSRC